MKRSLDIIFVVIACPILLILGCLVALLVKISSPGPVIYWSERVGRNNTLFKMPKFRTMVDGAPQLATHMLGSPGIYLTPVGSMLRKSSLDELPQFWSVIRGELSLVGPRPALFNQYDLIEMRTRAQVHKLTPGLTGWAQVNGRDQLSISKKVKFDIEYLEKKSILFDLKILWMTLKKVLKNVDVAH